MGRSDIILWVLFGLSGGIPAFAATLIGNHMLNKINANKPEAEHLKQYGWGGYEVRQRYKQLFPGDNLVRWFDLSVVVMVISFALGVRFWVHG
jgi:hypothetical protein